MRIITVEEHFEHPEVSGRVLQLGGPPSGLPLEGLAEFGSIFNDDRDAATRLGGHRLAHMDAVGVDVQVVSHGNGSPSTLAAPESVDLCRQVNNDLAQQISEHPDRFRGFATLPLYDPGAAAEELRRCVGDLGFVGALIAGTFEGLFLDDARSIRSLRPPRPWTYPSTYIQDCHTRRSPSRITSVTGPPPSG